MSAALNRNAGSVLVACRFALFQPVADQVALCFASQRSNQGDNILTASHAVNDNAVSLAVNRVGAERNDRVRIALDVQSGLLPFVGFVLADVDRLGRILLHRERDIAGIACAVVDLDAAEAGGLLDRAAVLVARQLHGGAALLIGQGKLPLHAVVAVARHTAGEDRFIRSVNAGALHGRADREVAAGEHLAGDAVERARQTDLRACGCTGIHMQPVLLIGFAGKLGIDIRAVLNLDRAVRKRAGRKTARAVYTDAHLVLQDQIGVGCVELLLNTNHFIAQRQVNFADGELSKRAAEDEFGLRDRSYAARALDGKILAVSFDAVGAADVLNRQIARHRDIAGDLFEAALCGNLIARVHSERANLFVCRIALYRAGNGAVHNQHGVIRHIGVFYNTCVGYFYPCAVGRLQRGNLAFDIHIAAERLHHARSTVLSFHININGSVFRLCIDGSARNPDRILRREFAKDMAFRIAARQGQRRLFIPRDDIGVTGQQICAVILDGAGSGLSRRRHHRFARFGSSPLRNQGKIAACLREGAANFHRVVFRSARIVQDRVRTDHLGITGAMIAGICR